MSTSSEAAWRLDAARIVVQGGGSARLAMRGTSMLPLLHEPMTLEIRALHRRARIGDVVVFGDGERYVAHRVVGRRARVYLTCGDAQPEIVEHVAPEAVLGRVEAVWSDGSSTAARVDGWRHEVRGRWYGYGRPLRVALYAAIRRVRRLCPVLFRRDDEDGSHGT